MKDVPRLQAHLRERGRNSAIHAARLLLEMKVGGVNVDATGDQIGVGVWTVVNPHEVGKDHIASPSQLNQT